MLLLAYNYCCGNAGWTGVCAYIGFLGCWWWYCPVLLAGRGDLKHTINGKTGVKVNSRIPYFNKVVNVAEGYFSITPGNDLLIARSGKPGSGIVVIPKESVDSVDFITLAGWKTKVYYHDGKWQRV